MLVTGGAGFVGSHLCESLLANGHDVLCVDNFYTSSRRQIQHLLDFRGFALMRHDVTFPLYVEVDQIYNLACPASPIQRSGERSDATASDDPRQRKPDVTQARAVLGWEPTVALRDGRTKAIDYFDAMLRESGGVVPAF